MRHSIKRERERESSDGQVLAVGINVDVIRGISDKVLFLFFGINLNVIMGSFLFFLRESINVVSFFQKFTWGSLIGGC